MARRAIILNSVDPVVPAKSEHWNVPGANLALSLLLLAYLVLATLYNLAIPVGEAPDEPDHIRFVEIVLKTGQLPTIPKDSPRYSYEAEQPPLYYLIQAAWVGVLWPRADLVPDLKPNPAFSAAINYSSERHTAPNVFLHDYPPDRALPTHLMRLLSTLLGLLTLLIIWWAARLAWPQSTGIAIVAVGVVAFLPGFTFASATVSNDSIAATAGAMVLLGCVYQLKHGLTVRSILLIGSAVGLGMLAKRSLMVMLPLLIIVPLFVPTQESMRRWRAIGGAILLALVLGAWPLVSNLLTYGDPFATAVTYAAKPELIAPLQGRPGYWLSPEYHVALYNSLWGSFGIRNIDLPNLLYALYYVLLLLAVVGLVRRRKEVTAPQKKVLLVLAFIFLLINAGVAYQNTQFWAVQGRLLLPGIAAFALFIGFGLSLVIRGLPLSNRSRHISLLAFMLLLLAANLYALIQFILHAYYA